MGEAHHSQPCPSSGIYPASCFIFAQPLTTSDDILLILRSNAIICSYRIFGTPRILRPLIHKATISRQLVDGSPAQDDKMSHNTLKKGQQQKGKKAPVKPKKVEDEREQTFQAVVCWGSIHIRPRTILTRDQILTNAFENRFAPFTLERPRVR